MIPEKTLHTLEFARVLERLAGHTSFSVSKEMALQLRPLADREAVEALQEQVRETLRLQDARADLSLGGAHDIRPAVTRAALGGILDPGQLLDIHSTLEAAERSTRVSLAGRATIPDRQLPRAHRPHCPDDQRPGRDTG